MIYLGKYSFRLSNFPQYLQFFLREWGSSTKELEEQGKLVTANEFPEDDLRSFIRNVCIWGNYAGIAGRVLKQNDINIIRSSFISAWKLLDSNNPDIERAMLEINRIKNLGTPSFSSKHLRFLHPQLCPVLDSIICHRLGIYSFNGNLYVPESKSSKYIIS